MDYIQGFGCSLVSLASRSVTQKSIRELSEKSRLPPHIIGTLLSDFVGPLGVHNDSKLHPHIIGTSLYDKFKDVLIQDSTIMLPPHIIGNSFFNINLQCYMLHQCCCLISSASRSVTKQAQR